MLHDYELIARGTARCSYRYPNRQRCRESVYYEVPAAPLWRPTPHDGKVQIGGDPSIEHAIDQELAENGWYGYAHPGGMRYDEQWYCPRHAQMIIDEPDNDDAREAATQLKHFLWPDPLTVR